MNKRFEALAQEEKDHRNDRRHEERGPPQPTNSRFAQAADADRSFPRQDDRGPPQLTNSRFAQAADADRSFPRQDDRGPPQPTNSRFAQAADADRSDNFRDRRGPPPVQNSRFAAAAADAERERTDYEDSRGGGFGRNDDRGPPPVQNSRFAAAADLDRKDDNRGGGFGRNDDRGPPLVQNSRFAAVVAADDDYIPEDRRREQARGGGEDRDGGRMGGDDRRGRFDDDRRGGDRRGGGFDDRRSGGGYGDSNDRMDNTKSNEHQEMRPSGRVNVDDLLKPKAQPVMDNMFVPSVKATIKAPEHTDNMFVAPSKAKAEKHIEAEKKAKEDKAVLKAADAAASAAKLAKASDVESGLLNEFASGRKLGDDLKQWCVDQGVLLPSVENLLFHFLTEKEMKNPDPSCGWGSVDNYGAALLSLVEDDINGQMQVLWGIQRYCDKLGFPKLNDEYLVQSMFRSMYQFDLASGDAFLEWKEDESDNHIDGKLKAVIQTVDWFAWLEEDEEGEDEDEDEEE